MPRHLLSAVGLKARVADAISARAMCRIGDGDGLMLVVRPNGEASWVLRMSHAGQRRDMTLGRWPAVSLKQARDLADAARAQSASGIDPVAERQAARAKQIAQRAGSGDTVRKLFEDWHARLSGSAVYLGNIDAAFKKDVLPAIGSKLPHDVARADIVKILRTIEARDALEMVRRVRMWLRQMFEFGIDDERRPMLDASPVPMGTLASFKAHKARSFPAITNAGDVPALMRKIRSTEHWCIRTALLFSAYVFQRPTEIREATWDEFDLQAGRWLIPAARMKLKREHWVPLSTQVIALLRQHQGVVGEVGHVFPGRRYGEPISEGTLLSRLKTMGYSGTHTPHGFRAMARTILDEILKVDPRYIEKQLAHEPDDKLRGAYNRAEYWVDRVKMMQLWADWLDAQTSAA